MRLPLLAARIVELAAIVAGYGVRLAARRVRGPIRGPEVAAALAEALGPAYVKAAQILGARPDLLGEDWIAAFARLQDRVAPCAVSAIRLEIARHLGAEWESMFAWFDDEPIGSGSIAQVHRARLVDGRDVALKVLRPGIRRRVTTDVALFTALARFVGRLPGMRTMPIADIVGEVTQPLVEQLDLVREAQSIRRMRASFAGVERIRIPATIDHLCHDGLLTTEYAPGLTKLTELGGSAADRAQLALAGLRALFRMIFQQGFVHADMHPGNLYARGTEELVLLDFGLMASLHEKDLRDFVDFFFGLANDNGAECARVIIENATWLSPRFDRAAFVATMRTVIARHASLCSRDFEVAGFVMELIATQRRHGVRGSTRFMTVVIAMVVYEGICKQLYPECDFQREARGFLITARSRLARGAARIADPGFRRPPATRMAS